MYFRQRLRPNCFSFYKGCHTQSELKVPRTPQVSKAINNFFLDNKYLDNLKEFIPVQYLHIRRRGVPENLYLICPEIAKIIASHVKQSLDAEDSQIICETNAGLGIIATELLNNGIKLIRLYESCAEFRNYLKNVGLVERENVKLFTKDLFHMGRYSHMDKHDHGNRVEALLKNVPKKSWIDDPAMTIIGSMPNIGFIKYLIQSLVLQKDIINYGRIQLFAIIPPKYYGVLSAEPKDNLFAYQSWTILFSLIFDYELLDVFPRNLFLPWESPLNKKSEKRYPTNRDPDKMYLVKINFKKDLPVSAEYMLPLYYFVRQLYGTGSSTLIPTIEKWIPGSGINIIAPTLKHTDYFKEIGIFTMFRELNPQQILAIFKELIKNPIYHGSPFTAMIENELLKAETIETSMSEATQLEKNIIGDIEEKLDKS